MLTCPVSVPFGGIELPRAAWVVTLVAGGAPVRCWDGRSYLSLESWDDMPPSLRSRFARQGTVFAGRADLVREGATFQDDLEVLFVLRVPAAVDLSRTPEVRPRCRALRTAATLLDSRWPVPLPSTCRRVPVIDDPGAVRFVLRRTTSRGIYLPGKPVPAQPAALPAGSAWIAALPRGALPEVSS